MDFCIGTCAKIDQVDLVKQAEDLGVTHFGVGEGPLLFSDPYQQMALASQQTSTIKLGTMVTNPLTRIAPVTANSIATLNKLAPGRTFLGIGTANNALRSMGNRPATVGELVHSVEVIRGLLRGERVTHRWHGQETEIEFLDTNGLWYDIRDVPIWMAAGGPKGLKAAAALADAVIYCLGPQPGHDPAGPPRAGQGRRRSGPAGRLGQADLTDLVLPAAQRRDLGRRHRPRVSAPGRSPPASPTPAS